MRNLNKPPRYNLASIQAQQTLGGDVMHSDGDGQYVEWRDYAWLLAEKQRLQVELTDLKAKADQSEAEGERLRSLSTNSEQRYLRAEVENFMEYLKWHDDAHKFNAWEIWRRQQSDAGGRQP